MPIVSAKCTHCGANLNVDNTKEAAVCEFCGSAFIVEKAINNYNTNITANIGNLHADVLHVNDESSIDNKVKAANTFIKLDKFDAAERIFDELTANFPYDYRGWWGTIKVETRDFTDYNISHSQYMQLKKFYNNAEKVASTEDLNGIRDIFKGYCASVEQKLAALGTENAQNLSCNATQMKECENSIAECERSIQECEGNIKQKRKSYHTEKERIEQLNKKLSKDLTTPVGCLLFTAVAIFWVNYLWGTLDEGMFIAFIQFVMGMAAFVLIAGLIIFVVFGIINIIISSITGIKIKANKKIIENLSKKCDEEIRELQARIAELQARITELKMRLAELRTEHQKYQEMQEYTGNI